MMATPSERLVDLQLRAAADASARDAPADAGAADVFAAILADAEKQEPKASEDPAPAPPDTIESQPAPFAQTIALLTGFALGHARRADSASGAVAIQGDAPVVITAAHQPPQPAPAAPALSPARPETTPVDKRSFEPALAGALAQEAPAPYMSVETRPASLNASAIGASPVAPARLTPPESGTLVRVSVTEIASYLPQAVSQALVPITAEAPPHAPAPLAFAPPPQAALKVIKFAVEPEALGAVTVKLRISDNRIGVEIVSESRATQALLADARQDLSHAIVEAGYSVDSVDVRLGPSHAAVFTAPVQDLAASQTSNSGDEGGGQEKPPSGEEKSDAQGRQSQGRARRDRARQPDDDGLFV